MIESTCGENHGVVVGQFRRVAPQLTSVVPEMTTRYIANKTVWKILPDTECKVDLQQKTPSLARHFSVAEA